VPLCSKNTTTRIITYQTSLRATPFPLFRTTIFLQKKVFQKKMNYQNLEQVQYSSNKEFSFSEENKNDSLWSIFFLTYLYTFPTLPSPMRSPCSIWLYGITHSVIKLPWFCKRKKGKINSQWIADSKPHWLK